MSIDKPYEAEIEIIDSIICGICKELGIPYKSKFVHFNHLIGIAEVCSCDTHNYKSIHSHKLIHFHREYGPSNSITSKILINIGHQTRSIADLNDRNSIEKIKNIIVKAHCPNCTRCVIKINSSK